MSEDKKFEGKTVNWLLNMYATKQIEQDICQRAPRVWNLQQQKRLIETMLKYDNRQIGEFTLCKHLDGRITCLDGQQRTIAIEDYLSNQWPLNSSSVKFLRKQNIKISERNSGAIYSNLPLLYQEKLRKYEITIHWINQNENESDQDFLNRKKDIFESINNGKPVSKYDKNIIKHINNEKHSIIALLRKFQNMTVDDGTRSGRGRCKEDVYFVKPNNSADSFSFSTLFMIIYIMSRISQKKLELLPGKNTADKLTVHGKWVFPVSSQFQKIIENYETQFSQEMYEDFKILLNDLTKKIINEGVPFVGHESSSLEDKAKSWNNLRIALSVILNLNIEQLPEFPLNADVLDNSKITYFGSRENSYVINKMQDLLNTYFPVPK